MRYTTVLFDTDDTLLDFRRAETEALRTVFRRHGLPQDGDFVNAYRRINNALWERFNRGEIEKREITETRFSLLFREFSVPLDGADFNDRYLDCLSRLGYLLPGADALCRTLHEAGLALYTITNGVGFVQKRRFAASGLAPNFDGVFISEEIGAAKPAKAFFDYVLAHVREQDTRRILVVGDSLTADVAGGKHAGLDACWFDPHHTDAPNDADYTVRDFQALCNLLLEGTA